MSDMKHCPFCCGIPQLREGSRGCSGGIRMGICRNDLFASYENPIGEWELTELKLKDLKIEQCVNPIPDCSCNYYPPSSYWPSVRTLNSITQGWQCPICKMIMSPFAPQCWNCKPINQDTNKI